MRRLTGWYGRATENDHRAMFTMVHFVEDGKPICGYRPHKTMIFQFCASGFYDNYVECPACRRKKEKMK